MDGERVTHEISHDLDHAKRVNKHLMHKLEKHGADAQGVVMEMGVFWQPNFNSPGYICDKRLRIDVRFPDGSTTAFSTVVESLDQRVDPVPGTIVPVRYDPEDHTRIAIDADTFADDSWRRLTAIKAKEDAETLNADTERAAQDQAAIAAAKAKLAAGDLTAS